MPEPDGTLADDLEALRQHVADHEVRLNELETRLQALDAVHEADVRRLEASVADLQR